MPNNFKSVSWQAYLPEKAIQNLQLKDQRVHYLFIMPQLQWLISILLLLKSKRLLTATKLSEKFAVSII
jgi:hypothetical protein